MIIRTFRNIQVTGVLLNLCVFGLFWINHFDKSFQEKKDMYTQQTSEAIKHFISYVPIKCIYNVMFVPEQDL